MLPEVVEQVTSYAVPLAGVDVVIENDVFLEYVPAIVPQPLPRASERVVGLIQRQGFVLPVFDAAQTSSARNHGKAISVLVVGEGLKAAAVMLRGQPRLVKALANHSSAGRAQRPTANDCVFASALADTPSYDASAGPDSAPLWLLDPDLFFHLLSTHGYQS